MDNLTSEEQAELNVAYTLGGRMIEMSQGHDSASVATALCIALAYVIATRSTTDEEALSLLDEMHHELINGVKEIRQYTGT